MLDKNNEVFFEEYCKTCKYKNYSETDSPCEECIAEPVNLYSHKPVKWEGANGIFSGPPPRPDHAYQRAVKYIPEKRKDKEKAIARLNIDAEYTGNKVQSIDGEITDDQYPSATAVKKALEGQNEVNAQALAKKIDAPSGCKCGEFLAVEEVDEEGVVKKVVAKEAETAPPDWNDNDPTKPGYVNNRTHWKEEIPYTVIAYASVPATDEHILYGDINEKFAKLLNDSNVSNGVDTIVVDGVSIVSKCTGFTSWYQRYDTVIFKGDGIEECKVSKQKNVLQLTMDSSSGVTFEIGTEYSIQFLNTKQTSPLYHTLDAEYIPIGSGLKVKDQKIVSTVGQKYAGGTSESAGDVFNDVTNNKASASYSHAEGYSTTASGDYGSHAEGYRTIASGDHGTHAEGNGTEAQGSASHAEGTGTEAQGYASHAEGYYTIAKSMDSHTEGRYTIASDDQQHVQGRSNIEDTEGEYAHIVGNGTTAGSSSNVKRSNAHTLDWKGNAWFAGNVYIGSTSGTNKDDGSVRLATIKDLSTCFRVNLNPTENDDGTVTYVSDNPASFMYYVMFGLSSNPGNSIECYLKLNEEGITVLNFIESHMTRLEDGNMALSFKFSSYVSDKQISAEIKDTISGFNTDDEKILSTVVTVTENALVSYSTTQELTYEQQAIAKQNIGAGTLRNVYYWSAKNDTPENPNSVMRCAVKGDTCICREPTSLPHGMIGPVLVIWGVVDRGYRSVTVFDGSNATWIFTVDLRDLSYSTPIKKSGIPTPTTAQVGQIVKVKAVDADGKVTETEAVDMPTQKHLKWITVHSSDLTEEKTEIVISTDSNGKTIASYNPIGLTLVLSTPADSTQTDNNGAPWVYPSATYMDNTIRVIGTIADWKTTARDNVFTFIGGSSAMSCTGNGNTQLATYKIDGYSLDGAKAFLNGTSNHFPIGTHIEVSILCESN